MSNLCEVGLKAYSALFNFENALRMFVYLVFKERDKHDWTTMRISYGDGEGRHISQIIDSNIERSKEYNYLLNSDNCPLLYLTYDNLCSLISDGDLWRDYFARYFPDIGRKALLHKLDEIRAFRNAIAHFRSVREESLHEIANLIGRQFVGVNTFLEEAMIPFGSVPLGLSSSEDRWYLDMCDMQFQGSPVEIAMSPNGKWVSVQFCYRSECLPVQTSELFGMPLDSSRGSQFLTRLLTPRICTHDKTLKEAIAYIVEAYSRPHSTEDLNGSCVWLTEKSVVIAISRRVLKKRGSEIAVALSGVFAEIQNQHETVVLDPAALVKFIERAPYELEEDDDISYVEPWWATCPRKRDDPVEYWGAYRAWVTRNSLNFFENPTFFPWQGLNDFGIQIH